ncbi:hypothetical protein WMZ97_04765 [Lentibacillus sp. N15]|uniref:zinc ribbon domain-containing protein n=1 Tax=Lentibacillus songyuanensis TaxID=3136161 RepID=UPI0031B9F20E
MKFCKHCGGEIADHARFCKHCGQEVTGGHQSQEETSVNNQADQTDKGNDGYIETESPQQSNGNSSADSGQSGTDSAQDKGASDQPSAPKQPSDLSSPPKQGGIGTTKKTTTAQPMKKMSKKSKIFIGIGALVVVLLIVAYQVGASMTSKDKMVEKFEDAVTKKDAATVAELLQSDSKKIKINKDSVAGFIDYYSENPSEFDYIVEHLKDQVKEYDKNADKAKANSEENKDMYALNLTEDGKKFAIYKNYTIQVSPVYFKVSTNFKDTDILLNDKVIATSDSDDFTKEVGPFLPGSYKFTAKYKGDYVELTADAESTNFDPGYADDVDLYIEADEVSFGTAYMDGLDEVTLFINGEDTGVNIMKEDTFGPVLVDGSMTASFEGKFPWGTMKTEEKPIDSYYMNAEFTASDDLKETLKDTIIKFNQEFLAATTTASKKKLTTATDKVVKDVVDDAKFAKESDQYYKGKFIGVDFYQDSYDITNYGDGWVVKVDTVTIYEEANWYKDDKKPKLKKNEEDYGYELVYDKDKEKWKVSYIGYAGSMDENKMDEHREKDPKTYTSAWLK